MAILALYLFHSFSYKQSTSGMPNRFLDLFIYFFNIYIFNLFQIFPKLSNDYIFNAENMLNRNMLMETELCL